MKDSDLTTEEYGLIEPNEELPTVLCDTLEEARACRERWGNTDRLVKRYVTPWVAVEEKDDA